MWTCAESSIVKSHLTLFALSDTTDIALSIYLQPVDNKVYNKWINLISSLNKLKEIINESNDEDLLHNVDVAIGDAEAYMKHQTQDSQQK